MTNNILILGKTPLAAVEVKESTINYLFSALFLTQFLVFLGGNLITRDSTVFHTSAEISFSCLQVSAIFYMFTRLLRSVSWGLVATYGLLFLITWYKFSARQELGFAIGCVGILYVILFLRISKSQFLTIFGIAAICGAMCLTIKNAYTSFDMVSRLYAGDLKIDPIFHSSIAAMIKNYGIISTGLNGLIKVPYYALSHTLMGSISLLSNRSVLEVYGVASYVLFAPILVLAISATCIALDFNKELSPSLLWGFTASILWLTPRIFGKWSIWDSYFVSESYMVSLGLFIVALPVLFKQKLNWIDVLFVLLAAPLIAYAKATTGLFYAGLWLSRILFIRTGKRPANLDIISFVLAAATIGAVVLAPAKADTGGITIGPFDFLTYGDGWGSGYAVSQIIPMIHGAIKYRFIILRDAFWQILGFFPFHFFFSWVVIYAAVRKFNWGFLLKAPITVYVLASTAVGLLAIFTLKIPGGSLYYISNISMFVALPTVIALAVSNVRRLNISPHAVLGILLVVILAGSVHLLREDVSRVAQDRQFPKNSLIHELIALRSTSLNNVYRYRNSDIPILYSLNCQAYPFLFPAISEHAWIDVIKPQTKCPLFYYGFGLYGLTLEKQKVTVAPKLLSGMRIVDFTSQAATASSMTNQVDK